jgi:hypothetical protein
MENERSRPTIYIPVFIYLCKNILSQIQADMRSGNERSFTRRPWSIQKIFARLLDGCGGLLNSK